MQRSHKYVQQYSNRIKSTSREIAGGGDRGIVQLNRFGSNANQSGRASVLPVTGKYHNEIPKRTLRTYYKASVLL